MSKGKSVAVEREGTSAREVPTAGVMTEAGMTEAGMTAAATEAGMTAAAVSSASSAPHSGCIQHRSDCDSGHCGQCDDDLAHHDPFSLVARTTSARLLMRIVLTSA
jgi:hypothetical protein